VATSGTYTFNPSAGEIVLTAYARAQMRRTALTPEHMVDARNEMNFLLSEMSNQQVNLWTVELVEEPLLEGVATYDVDPTTVMILDAYISSETSGAVQDRVIMPISRTEYASYPNKDMEGFVTSFWFDRLINPTITLWPVPNADDTYTLKYYRCRQVQDAVLTNALNIEVPYRWLDCFAFGLAWRLALIHNPQMAEPMFKLYDRSWKIAATQDTENVPMYIYPALSHYSR